MKILLSFLFLGQIAIFGYCQTNYIRNGDFDLLEGNTEPTTRDTFSKQQYGFNGIEHTQVWDSLSKGKSFLTFGNEVTTTGHFAGGVPLGNGVNFLGQKMISIMDSTNDYYISFDYYFKCDPRLKRDSMEFNVLFSENPYTALEDIKTFMENAQMIHLYCKKLIYRRYQTTFRLKNNAQFFYLGNFFIGKNPNQSKENVNLIIDHIEVYKIQKRKSVKDY